MIYGTRNSSGTFYTFSTRPEVFIRHLGEDVVCSVKQRDVLVIYMSGSAAFLFEGANNYFYYN
jgi:hypothetical protein